MQIPVRYALVGVGLIAVVVTLTVGLVDAEEKAAIPKVGEAAREFELPVLGGESTKLSQLTANGPVVLVVLRGYPGYQCPICSTQVGEFLGRADEFKKAKAQVVLIYPGPSNGLKERASEFIRGKDYPEHFRILLDPGYRFTQAYGLRWNQSGETAYPSTFVIDAAGKITFAQVSKTHGGRVKANDALKALLTR